MAEYLGVERHVWAIAVAGVFTFLTMIVSIYSMMKHVKYNSNPILRKYTLIILGMPPVYAITSWLGLFDKKDSFAFGIARECYESLVIYAFFAFLLSYLAKDKNHLDYISDLDGTPTNSAHLFPLKYCFKPWSTRPFILNVMLGTLQYVVIKLLCTLVILILSICGVYHTGHLAFSDGYPYIVIIGSMSQMWAMYCLMMFYYRFKQDLIHIRPIAQLFCIKAVVFFTFWQGVFFAGMVKMEVIRQTSTYSVEQSSEGLQNFIISIEMFIASVLMIFAFPFIEFYDPKHPSHHYKSWVDYFMAMFWPIDSFSNSIDLNSNSNSNSIESRSFTLGMDSSSNSILETDSSNSILTMDSSSNSILTMDSIN
jgi:hypothetical protein